MEALFVVLIIVNIILYHLLFKVYYLNLGTAFIGEIICAALAAIAEIIFVPMIISKIGRFIATGASFVLKIFIVIAILALIASAIIFVLKKFSE